MVLSSSRCLSSLRPAAHGSAYLLTHRSWTSRIGTTLRKCSFSRPRRLATTRPASSSTRRCLETPKRVIGSRCSSSVSVCPSRRNSSSSRLRRGGGGGGRERGPPPVRKSGGEGTREGGRVRGGRGG